jgi:two-component system, chemotaxis family, response regulator Rcp1
MTPTQLILLVEDNPADARLTVEAFHRADAELQIEICEDGESALARLRDASAPLPRLILLDLNLPGIDGREVLEAIKADPELRQVPVCILTTSRAEADIERAYAQHTNAYVVKPVDLNAFRAAVQQIERFWLGTAEIPTPRRIASSS